MLLTDTHHADLRWANNTLTTNGEARGVDVSVVAISEAGGVGTVSGTAATREQVEALVAVADAESARADPAADRAPLVTADQCGHDDTWSPPPEPTSVAVFSDLAAGLGEAFARAQAESRLLYGFVSHEARPPTWAPPPASVAGTCSPPATSGSRPRTPP